MDDAENDKMIVEHAQSACLALADDVLARARQTNTPIIVFEDNRIQKFTSDEYAKRISSTAFAIKNEKD